MFFLPVSKVGLSQPFSLSSTAQAAGRITVDSADITLAVNGTGVTRQSGILSASVYPGDVVVLAGRMGSVKGEQRYIAYTLDSGFGTYAGQHYTLAVAEEDTDQHLFDSMRGVYWDTLTNVDGSAITDNRLFRYENGTTRALPTSGAGLPTSDTVVLTDYPRARLQRYKPDGTALASIVLPFPSKSITNVANGDFFDVWALCDGSTHRIDRTNTVTEVVELRGIRGRVIAANSHSTYVFGDRMYVLKRATGELTDDMLPEGTIGGCVTETDIYCHTSTQVFSYTQGQWEVVGSSTLVGSIAVWGDLLFATYPEEKCIARLTGSAGRIQSKYMPMYLSATRSGMCATTLDSNYVLRVTLGSVEELNVGYRARFAAMYGLAVFLSEYGQNAKPYTYVSDKYCDAFTISGNTGVEGLAGSSTVVVRGITVPASVSCAPLMHARAMVNKRAADNVQSGDLVWFDWKGDRATRLPYHVAGQVGLLDVAAKKSSVEVPAQSIIPVMVEPGATTATLSFDIDLPEAVEASKQFGVLRLNGVEATLMKRGTVSLTVDMPVGIDQLQPVLTLGSTQFQCNFIRKPRVARTVSAVLNQPTETSRSFGSFVAPASGTYTVGDLDFAFMQSGEVFGKSITVTAGDVVNLTAMTSSMFRDTVYVTVVGPTEFFTLSATTEAQTIPNTVDLGQLVEPLPQIAYDSIEVTISGLEPGTKTRIQATRGALVVVGGVATTEASVGNGDVVRVRYTNRAFYTHDVMLQAWSETKGWVSFGRWQVLPIQLNGAQKWEDIEYDVDSPDSDFDTWQYEQAVADLCTGFIEIDAGVTSNMPKADVAHDLLLLAVMPTVVRDTDETRLAVSPEPLAVIGQVINTSDMPQAQDASYYVIAAYDMPSAQCHTAGSQFTYEMPTALYQSAVSGERDPVGIAPEAHRDPSSIGYLYQGEFMHERVNSEWVAEDLLADLEPTVWHDDNELYTPPFFTYQTVLIERSVDPAPVREADHGDKLYDPTAIRDESHGEKFYEPIALYVETGIIYAYAPTGIVDHESTGCPFKPQGIYETGVVGVPYLPSAEHTIDVSHTVANRTAIVVHEAVGHGASPSAVYHTQHVVTVPCSNAVLHREASYEASRAAYVADIAPVFVGADDITAGAFATEEAALQYAADVGFENAYTYRLPSGLFSFRKSIAQVYWCQAKPGRKRPAFWYLGGG